MPERLRGSSNWITSARALVLFAGLSVAFTGGCATDGNSSDAETAAGGIAGTRGAAHSRLKARSETELTAPDAQAALAPLPPGVDAASLAALDRSDPRAGADLTTACAEFVGQRPAGEPIVGVPVDYETRRQALRLYAEGKSKLSRNDAIGAAADFEAATKLDPASATPWRALADAQLAQGRRVAALASLQQAVRRGLVDGRASWLLGREALRSGRVEQAVRYLAEARAAGPTGDAALPVLIHSDLSEALVNLGYWSAGAEALEYGLGDAEEFGASTRMRTEYTEHLRRRDELWRNLGDMYVRLGRPDRALSAYETAAQTSALDPTGLMPRRVLALMRLGRPAAAGLLVVDQIAEAPGEIDRRLVALIPYVAATCGDDLAEAIGEAAEAASRERPPSRVGSIARARAAAAPSPEVARSLLSRHLAQRPVDRAALTEYLATVEQADAGRSVAISLSLVDGVPAVAMNAAEALLSSSFRSQDVLDALNRAGDSDAKALLLASVEGTMGRFAAAADRVIGRRWSSNFAVQGTLAEVRLAAACGRWDDCAKAMASSALGGTGPEAVLARASAQLAMQLPRAAQGTLETFLSTPGSDRPRVEHLLLASDAASMLDRGAEAEGYLRRAIEADPHDDRAYQTLIRLLVISGEKDAGERLSVVARSLRDAAPSSRVLRFSTAQELAQRPGDPQAVAILRSLVDEDPTDGDSGLLLVRVWGRIDQAGVKRTSPAERAELERVRAYLEAISARRPELPWVVVGVAQVMAAEGRAEEALKMVSERVTAWPIAALAETREALLRDYLGRAAESDQMAMQRLAPLPRSIDASCELVDVLARAGKYGEASAVLKSQIPREAVLTDAQRARVTVPFLRIARAQRVPTDGAIAVLLDAAVERDARLPAGVHELRVTLLASRAGSSDDEIRAAATLGAKQYPAMGATFYARAAAALSQTSSARRALAFLREAVRMTDKPTPDMLAELIRQSVIHGEAEDGVAIVEQFADRDVIAATLSRFSDQTIPTDLAKARAEFAYVLGNFFASQGKNPAAEALYRKAIAIDPAHGWAANNLGYQILEAGGDLNEASHLLEQAVKLLPDKSNVLDSLGWLRYKQGVLVDEVSTDGKVIREGAITLLKRAANIPDGGANATIIDHLADALWAAGRHDEAVEAWGRAEKSATDEIAKLQGGATPTVLERATAERDTIRKKRQAAAAGEQPAIAPRTSSSGN